MMANTKKEETKYTVVGITGQWWEVPHCHKASQLLRAPVKLHIESI